MYEDSNIKEPFFETVISVIGDDGKVELLNSCKADKLRTIPHEELFNDVMNLKKNLKRNNVGKSLDAFLPVGFVRVSYGNILHPNGLLLDKEWNRIPLFKLEDGTISFRGQSVEWVDLFELLVYSFKFNRNLVKLYTKINTMVGDMYTIDRSRIDKSLYTKKVNMRPYDLYIYNDGFSDMVHINGSNEEFKIKEERGRK